MGFPIGLSFILLFAILHEGAAFSVEFAREEPIVKPDLFTKEHGPTKFEGVLLQQFKDKIKGAIEGARKREGDFREAIHKLNLLSFKKHKLFTGKERIYLIKIAVNEKSTDVWFLKFTLQMTPLDMKLDGIEGPHRCSHPLADFVS